MCLRQAILCVLGKLYKSVWTLSDGERRQWISEESYEREFPTPFPSEGGNSNTSEVVIWSLVSPSQRGGICWYRLLTLRIAGEDIPIYS